MLDEVLVTGTAGLLTVAGAVHGGAQFLSDQFWAIGNLATGGWLSDHNQAAHDAMARNMALGQSIVGMPRQLSVLALRTMTGNWRGMDPSNSQQINALEAKGDRLGAKVLAGQTVLNIGGMALGGAGLLRSGLAVGSTTRTGALMAMDDVATNLATPRTLNSQFGGVRFGNVGSAAEAAATNIGFRPAARTGLDFTARVESQGAIIEVDLLSKQRFDRNTGEIITSPYARSHLIGRLRERGDLFIDWYETSVPGRGVGTEMLSRAVESVGPESVNSVSARFGLTNKAVFDAGRTSGLSLDEAAWATPLGKSMRQLGFKNANATYDGVTFGW